MTGYGELSDYFRGIGFKRLKAVEIDPKSSNEHEFNGISRFKELFGFERRHFPARILYLCDEENELLDENTIFTWYDARESHPVRSEHRLYYPASQVIEKAEVGDLLVIALDASQVGKDQSLTVFVVKHGDNIERQLAWLFGFQLDDAGEQILIKDEKGIGLDFFTKLILDKIGINIIKKDDNFLEILLQNFPDNFPSTKVFSAFARNLVPDVNLRDGADEVLVAWMDVEEKAFRLLEHHFVSKYLKNNILSVENFLSYSLSVQNRRKSRAGHALENHLCHLFSQLNIKYAFNVTTENRVRPDFLFPGIAEYRDLEFPVASLNMLGVKTTCKDRWRQVLSEAQRIPDKHLLTLEPSISEEQTKEMSDKHLCLIVPRQIFSSYTAKQQAWLMDIEGFIQHIRHQQA